MKKCPKRSSYRIKKYGTKLGRQRYKCNTCGHVFQEKKRKVSNGKIYQEYLEGKQTYNQLAKKYGKCRRSIQYAVDKVRVKKKILRQEIRC